MRMQPVSQFFFCWLSAHSLRVYTFQRGKFAYSGSSWRFLCQQLPWIEEAALIVLLGVVVLVGVGTTFWWIGSKRDTVIHSPPREID